MSQSESIDSMFDRFEDRLSKRLEVYCDRVEGKLKTFHEEVKILQTADARNIK